MEKSIKIKLLQDAYISDSGETYEACACDVNDADEEVGYMVYWDVIQFDEPELVDDESEACDWGKYTVYDLSNNNEEVQAVIVNL